MAKLIVLTERSANPNIFKGGSVVVNVDAIELMYKHSSLRGTCVLTVGTPKPMLVEESINKIIEKISDL